MKTSLREWTACLALAWMAVSCGKDGSDGLGTADASPGVVKTDGPASTIGTDAQANNRVDATPPSRNDAALPPPPEGTCGKLNGACCRTPNVYCDAGTVCDESVWRCVASCCFTDAAGKSVCVAPNRPCGADNKGICRPGGTCAPCGTVGATCCAGASCGDKKTVCVTSVSECRACGGPGQPCCPSNSCDRGCCGAGTCVDEGQLCDGQSNHVCKNQSCGGCGGSNEPCCVKFTEPKPGPPAMPAPKYCSAPGLTCTDKCQGSAPTN